MKKIITLGVTLLLVLALLSGCANNKTNVVATVNGEDISEAELDKRVNFTIESYKLQGFDLTAKENSALLEQLRQSELEKLIQETLLLQEAKKQKVTPSNEEIDNNIKQVKETYGTDEDFKKALEQFKLTEDDFRELVATELATKNLYDKVTADVKAPTEEEIAKFYEEHKTIEPIGTPERLEVKHMLFAVDSTRPEIPKRTDKEALEAAKLALAEVTQKGRDFAAVARELSDDLGTRENGGSYTIDKGAGTTDPAFEKAAVALQPGEITKEPVKSAYGYHLIKLEKITPATQRPLAEVKDMIIAQLEGEAKQAKFSQFLADLQKNAKIENKIAPKTGDSSKK
ncbi:peptidylprolyl isomerase [Desulforamulus ferrireducens]|uniref:Peptidylprolyl isomerase n=1 Tax=Desulforamulus ferrireducens TaxID=1833852 RepID=A0A1S6ISX0_9FIRM|nr:SurA N-terminal domain-containing protein [Desulforamulus ferrireducens]AQS57864.1 peptidylprolyl isomerase [Desulforamulus ferrireducens]